MTSTVFFLLLSFIIFIGVSTQQSFDCSMEYALREMYRKYGIEGNGSVELRVGDFDYIRPRLRDIIDVTLGRVKQCTLDKKGVTKPPDFYEEYTGTVAYIILSSMQLYGLTNLKRVQEPILKGAGNNKFQVFFKISVPDLDLIGKHEIRILRTSYDGRLAIGFPKNEVLMVGTLDLTSRRCLQLDRIILVKPYTPEIYLSGFGLFNRYAAGKVSELFNTGQQQMVETITKTFRKNSEDMLNEVDCEKLGLMIA